jgi:hypothetical protein
MHACENLLWIISVGFEVTDQLLTRFSAVIRNGRKEWVYGEKVHQLFTDLKKAYDSVRCTAQYSHRVWDTHKISQAD